MRRRERQVTDMDEIKYILDTCKVLHLGLVDDGMPYVVPMNYGYRFEDGKLVFYIHGAVEGRKLDVIRKNSNCCVEMMCDGEMFEGELPCQYGYIYYSLMGFGNVKILETPEEKMEAMTVMMKTLTGKDFEFNERLVSIVSLMRIECDSYTAKHRPLPAVHQAKRDAEKLNQEEK